MFKRLAFTLAGLLLIGTLMLASAQEPLVVHIGFNCGAPA